MPLKCHPDHLIAPLRVFEAPQLITSANSEYFIQQIGYEKY